MKFFLKDLLRIGQELPNPHNPSKNKMERKPKVYKPHWSFFIKSMVLGGGGGFIFLLISPFLPITSLIISFLFFQWPVRVFLKWLSIKWTIDDKELIIKSGFLEKEDRIPFHDIHNFGLDQKPLGTIFNYGSVLLCTSTKMGDVWLHYVPNPRNFIAEIYRKLSYI